MGSRAIITLSLLLLVCSGANAADRYASVPYSRSDSLEHSPVWRSALPAAMLANASLYNDNTIGRSIVRDGAVNLHEHNGADLIQYSPGFLLAGLKLCGVEGRSDWNRLLASGAISTGIMTALVNGLKYTVKRERPDGRAHNSFPSGHTTTSFMCATMLHKEYGGTISPWISVAGYGIAAATALYRIESDRHWISDAIAGAGIGIFSVEMGYELTDVLFPGRKYAPYEKCVPIGEQPKWNFSLQSSYSLQAKDAGGSYGHPGIRPACSLFINADYMPWYVGATVSAGITQLQWSGSGSIRIPDGSSMPDLQFIGAGIAANVPLTHRISLGGRALAGNTIGVKYSLTYSDGTALDFEMPSGMRVLCDMGLSIRTTENTAVRAFAGLDSYGKVWNSCNIGTQFTFMF